MNILVIEDDAFKYSKIYSLIDELDSEKNITHCDNVFAAINYIRESTPDKIILDMALPSHPAIAGQGSPVSMYSGGIEILLEIRICKKGKIPIVILTQYPDIVVEYEYYSIEDSEKAIKELYGIDQLSVVHYDNDSDEWEICTRRFLGK